MVLVNDILGFWLQKEQKLGLQKSPATLSKFIFYTYKKLDKEHLILCKAAGYKTFVHSDSLNTNL